MNARQFKIKTCNNLGKNRDYSTVCLYSRVEILYLIFSNRGMRSMFSDFFPIMQMLNSYLRWKNFQMTAIAMEIRQMIPSTTVHIKIKWNYSNNRNGCFHFNVNAFVSLFLLNGKKTFT